MNRDSERRKFFRINDIIGLNYSTLEGGQEFEPGVEGDMGMPMVDLLAQVDQNFNQVTNVLWHERPAMAQALGLLNRKISIVAAHMLQVENQPAESYEEMMVNISGCGIGFHSAEFLEVGTPLKLSTLLKPSNIRLKFTGKVVGCEALHEGSKQPYWMRVSLDEDDAGAQEQLIQHIVQRQCAQMENKITAIM